LAENKIRVLLKEGALRALGLFLIMKSIKTYSIAMGQKIKKTDNFLKMPERLSAFQSY